MPHIPDLGVVRSGDMLKGPRIRFQGGRDEVGIREVVLGVYHSLEDGCETKVDRLRSSLARQPVHMGATSAQAKATI